MSELQSDVLTYLAALDAIDRDDLATLSEHVSADFVYRIPGRSKVAGDLHGVDGFVDALTRLREESAGTIESTPRPCSPTRTTSSPVPA